jgi:glycosyltransferase involved in cell wall biosynthesis
MRQCPESIKLVSWQGLKLFRANFAGLQLRGLDFRDSDLQEADFRAAKLENVRFDASSLVGAKFDAAQLAKANLAYADLARASMQGADLKGADLRNIKLLDLNVSGADLRGASFALHATEWKLLKNWRDAILDPAMRTSLLEKYGPPVGGPKILMLMWEYPPIVSGGGWTAVYHFLRTLRRLGAHVIVIVPLPASVLDREMFGNEIETIGVGREEDIASLSETSAYTSYRTESSLAKAVKRFQYEPAQYSHATTSLMTLVNEFQLRAVRKVDELGIDCDVIHAHDWLTFPAAAALAESLSKPWVAHFHSTEQDRQPDDPSPKVLRLEADACRNATRLVAVSQTTSTRLTNSYKAVREKIDVVPNCLSEEPSSPANLGSFNSKRVVFLGRLAKQKGIDRFIEIAAQVRKMDSGAEFIVFGDGPEKERAFRLATEEHKEIPEEEIVPPLRDDEWRRSVRHVSFNQIVPLSKEADGSFKFRGIPLAGKSQQAIEEKIFRRGFTATAVESPPYTHIIHVQPQSDDIYPDYAVEVYVGLRKIRRWSTQFVTFAGGLPWVNRFDAFDRASVVIVPSRFEPFGLVVLEAMSHGVPVIYPKTSGVAEVRSSGVQFESIQQATQETHRLLTDQLYWDKTVEAELLELSKYFSRGYEVQLQEIWNRIRASSDKRILIRGRIVPVSAKSE